LGETEAAVDEDRSVLQVVVELVLLFEYLKGVGTLVSILDSDVEFWVTL